MPQDKRDEIFIPSLMPGSSLYHYTSAEGLAGISQGEFWVTESNFLNDPSEFSLGATTVIDVIKAHVRSCKQRDRLISKLMKEMQRLRKMAELDDSFAFAGDYVISFCLEQDNELLWAKYSGFQGYCLGFSFDELEKSFQNGYISWNGKVVYDPNEQVGLIEKALANDLFACNGFEYLTDWNSIPTITNEQTDEVANYLCALCDLFGMFFKKECFAGEKEYRFVFSHIHDKGRIRPEERTPLHFRICNGVLTPFVKMQFDASRSLESVLIGPRNTSDIAVKGLEYFFRNLGMTVKLSKSSIPLRY